MAEPRIQYVTSFDGVRIAYTSIGEGDAVVFVSNVWGEIQLALERAGPIYGTIADALLRNSFRLVVYDGRGCGESDRDVHEMSHAARLADLDAVINRLQLKRFTLLAIIHGSPTAISYAARHPERVSHLVLEVPYAHGADYYARGPSLRAIKALMEMAEDNWEFFTLTLANWLLNFRSGEAAAELAATYRKGSAAAPSSAGTSASPAKSSRQTAAPKSKRWATASWPASAPSPGPSNALSPSSAPSPITTPRKRRM